MYGENTKTIAIPIYRVLPYPVIGRGVRGRQYPMTPKYPEDAFGFL